MIGFASCTKNTLKDIELSDSPFAENSGIDLFVIDSGNIEGTGIFAIGHIYYRINWEPFSPGYTIDELRIYRDDNLIRQLGPYIAAGAGESVMYYKDLDVTQGPYFSYAFSFYSEKRGETKKTYFGMSS